jgi:hypothetical protein
MRLSFYSYSLSSLSPQAMRYPSTALNPALSQRTLRSEDTRFSASRRDSNYKGRLRLELGQYISHTDGVTFRRKVGKKLETGREVLLADVTVKPLATDPTQVEITYKQVAKYLNIGTSHPSKLGVRQPLTIIGKPGAFRVTEGTFEKHDVNELATGLLNAALKPPASPTPAKVKSPKPAPKPKKSAPQAQYPYSGGGGGRRSRSRWRGF